MAWRDWLFPPKVKTLEALTADAVIVSDIPVNGSDALAQQRQLYPQTAEWQREVWDFYDSLGEFRQGVQWKANMMSRVRLVAARRRPGVEEPEIITTGEAADLVADLAGGIGGQAALMSSFSTYFDVPGECYLIGETLPSGVNKWYVRSMEEVQRNRADGAAYQVREGTSWRTLPDNSMVVRAWRPHRRNNWVADAPSRPARTLMRELELLNRHIAAQYMSRLASAGVIIFPDEVTFPTRPEFADEPDPFVAEWVEIAAEALATPGTAAAVVPIPIKVPGEYVDKIRHIDFTLKLDDSIIEKRNSALTRLAISLDMPPEALLGTTGVNHWSAWLIDEQGVKIHVAPTVELVCAALTTGYLTPRLKAAGEDPDEWLVWYDASNLILRPDRSKVATDAYDRLEISGEAYRRDTGFDESDKPTDEELRRMILIKASLQPVNTFAAMDELGLNTSHDTPPAAPRPPGEPAPTQDQPVDGPPESPPVRPQNAVTQSVDLAKVLTHQAGLMHALRITARGSEMHTDVFHPEDCAHHLFSCPVTHAMWKPHVSALPGRQGTYECWLNPSGQPIIGKRITSDVTRDMLSSSRVNGVAH